MVVYSLYRKLTQDGMADHELGIFVVNVDNVNNSSNGNNMFGKDGPPNYTEIVLDPPPPDYDRILNVKFNIEKKESD